MARSAVRVEWMPAYGEHGQGRVRVYMVESTAIVNGALHLYQARTLPDALTPVADSESPAHEKHIPLSNIRIWEPVKISAERGQP